VLSDEFQKHLEMAHGSARNLLTIINDILDVSKIESGNFALEITCLDVPQTIQNVLSTLEPLAKEKGLALDFHFDGNLSDCYLGDATRLGQAIFNLVGNAIKFSGNGNVTIAVNASEQGGDLLHFTVADNGVGMTPEQATTIFNPFDQADISTARCYGGTGLGLTIVKQVVELMGGLIWVESELGKGSTFHFTAQLPETPCNEECLNHGITEQATFLDQSAASKYCLQRMFWEMPSWPNCGWNNKVIRSGMSGTAVKR